ncbi:MAG: hypothetical protein N2035_08345, partial [Chthoniobacterales bacterium]|nr:hypothetical protein [Chthoniobacterales bacterium]
MLSSEKTTPSSHSLSPNPSPPALPTQTLPPPPQTALLPFSPLPSLRRYLIPAAILLLAATIRFWDLELKPPHFDEGVNGWFADQLRAQGYFRYDPENYHGPLHFYAIFLTQTLFGRSVFALRLPAVLASIAAVAAILALSLIHI